MRDFEKKPLILDKHKNKLEDLQYIDLVELLDRYNLTQIKKLLKVSDNYIYRQLKLHNVTKKKDGRKNENKLTKEEYELQKYGRTGLSRSEKLNMTIEKIGKETFWKNHNNKFKKTWDNHTKEFEQQRQEKIKITKLQRYGNKNFTNQEKREKSNLEKYGVTTRILDKDILAKTHSKEIINKMNESRAKTWKNKPIEEKKEIYQKIKENNLKRIGYISHMQDPKWREMHSDLGYFGSAEHLNNIEAIQKKRRATMKKNGTTNTSRNFEDKLIKFMREKYPEYTIIQSYTDNERYPFECDCYVKELDLFIEFQGSYFHNYRPFNESATHIQEYEDLVAKGNQRKAIAKVWRYNDPLKRQIAKENNLNYLEYWENSMLIEEYDPIQRWLKLCHK